MASKGTRSDSGWKSYEEVAAQTVSPYRAVKEVGGKIQHAGAGEGNLVAGFAQEPTGEADKWAIKLLKNSAGTFLAEVAAAVAVDQVLYLAASGKLTPVRNGAPIVRAMEAGTGDGSIIEVRALSQAEADAAPFEILPLLGNGITAAELAAATGLTLGMYARSKTGGLYQLIKNDNVNGAPIGSPLGIRTAGTTGSDLSDDLLASAATQVRGISANVLAGTDIHGWMLVEGDLEAEGMHIDTDGNVTAGDFLYWGADNLAHGAAAGDAPADITFFGRAHKDDSGSVLSVGTVSALCGGINQAA